MKKEVLLLILIMFIIASIHFSLALQTSTLTVNLELKSATVNYNTGIAEIQVHRPIGEADLVGLKFIFFNGVESKSTEIESWILELETKTVSVLLPNLAGINEIRVAAIVNTDGENLISEIKDTIYSNEIVVVGEYQVVAPVENVGETIGEEKDMKEPVGASGEQLSCPGDADINGYVDLPDLVILARNWHKEPATWRDGDFDLNGIVDLPDLVILARNWHAVCPIYGTSGDDIFQIKYGKIYLNGVDKGAVTGDNLVLYGMEGDDTFTTIGTNSQIIYGGEGVDSFWVDSSDEIKDASSEEQNGFPNSPVSSVHIVSEYYQPVTIDPLNPSYIPLNANGQNLVDPAADRFDPAFPVPVYQDYSQYSLFVDEPEFNDIRQGYLGDCWLVAVFSSISNTDPWIIKQTVVDLGDNTYAVRLYNLYYINQPTYIRVDSWLPCCYYGENYYSRLTRDNELWVAIIEKAFASHHDGKNAYSSLQGGWMHEASIPLTDADVLPNYYVSSRTESEIGNYVNSNHAFGHSESAGTLPGIPGPIVGGHAYALLPPANYIDKKWSITVYNPWGYDGRTWDSNPWDGVLVIPMSNFKSYFTAISVSLS